MATMESSSGGTHAQIVVIGGGGFANNGTITPLEEYVLAQAKKPRPSVCFLPTASGDDKDLIIAFYEAFAKVALPSHLSLFSGRVDSAPAKLAEADIVFVGPGNTVNLVAIIRAHGLDRHLQACANRGAVLAGVSAGAACWFESAVTDSYGELAALKHGLGLLPGSFCPHYDTEEDRRGVYHQLVATGELADGLALDDGVAAHFVNGTLVSTVSMRAIAYSYDVRRIDGQVRETKIRPRLFGT